VSFGVARAANSKIVSAFAKLAHKLDCVTVIRKGAIGTLYSIGNITSESHNVLNARILDIGYPLPHRFLG
jgi:hypothetical protein